jgi:hypothetical protein
MKNETLHGKQRALEENTTVCTIFTRTALQVNLRIRGSCGSMVPYIATGRETPNGCTEEKFL